MAPLAAALAFHHARRALGGRRAAGELLALAAYGFALEAVAMAVFASHAYAASWRAAPLGVPLAVAAVWAAVITSAMAVAGRRGWSRGGQAWTAALIAITLDLMIEPVAVRAGLWRWTPPGPWLEVPIGNFVGWGVIVGAYAYGAARWAGTDPAGMQALRRIALAAACIVALVAVGLAWTSLGLERVFAGGRGWLAWASILAATLWRMVRANQEAADAAGGGRRWGGLGGERGGSHALRRRSPPSLMTPAPDDSLPALLAATPGRAPEAVLCVVALAFAAEAVRIAEPAVMVAAAGPLAVIAVVAAGFRRR